LSLYVVFVNDINIQEETMAAQNNRRYLAAQSGGLDD
jgi:hypothetical protein